MAKQHTAGTGADAPWVVSFGLGWRLVGGFPLVQKKRTKKEKVGCLRQKGELFGGFLGHFFDCLSFEAQLHLIKQNKRFLSLLGLLRFNSLPKSFASEFSDSSLLNGFHFVATGSASLLLQNSPDLTSCARSCALFMQYQSSGRLVQLGSTSHP